MKARNIVMFNEGGIPKTKLAMLKWLDSHDKYQGEYEIGIRIRDLNRKTKDEEAALWHGLNNPFIGDRFSEELDEFHQANPRYDIRIQGRSNGHAVLCTADKEFLMEEEPDMDCTFKDIRERVKLVRDFDRVVNAAVLVFLELALDQYRQDQVLETALSGIRPESCEFIPASLLVPKELGEDFWGLISEDAPFSWGGNNRSLVTASSFADHCQQRLDDSKEAKAFVKRLNGLGELYIDLEN